MSARKFHGKGEFAFIDGVPLSPARSLKVRDHSPTGFAHGYGGSGPSQLALAILLEVTDQATAATYYQAFKWDHVANWPQDGEWRMFESEIIQWLDRARRDGR